MNPCNFRVYLCIYMLFNVPENKDTEEKSGQLMGFSLASGGDVFTVSTIIMVFSIYAFSPPVTPLRYPSPLSLLSSQKEIVQVVQRGLQ